jgi:hypothetical protein
MAVMRGKKLDESKLTPDERNEVLKYSTVACVLIAVGVLFGVMGWLGWWLSGPVIAVGLLIIAFVWGYVGALEDERSESA